MAVTRRAFKIGAYYTIGLFLIGYMALSVYFNVTKVEVPGLVTAPIFALQANVDGIVKEIGFRTGTEVSPGDTAVVLTNVEIEQERQRSEYRLRLAEHEQKITSKLEEDRRKELDRHKQQLIHEKENLERGSHLTQETSRARSAQFDRMNRLYDRKITTVAHLERSRDSLLAAETAMLEIDNRHRQLDSALVWAQDGYLLCDGKLDRSYRDATSAARAAAQRVEIEKESLEQISDLQNLLRLEVPRAGRVLRVYGAEGNGVQAGQAVVLIETNEAKIAEAAVPRKQLAKIATHRPAQIYIPSLGKRIRATVKNIDHSPDQERLQRLGSFGWTTDVDAGAIVQLELQDPSAVDQIPSGSPALVRFARRLPVIFD